MERFLWQWDGTTALACPIHAARTMPSGHMRHGQKKRRPGGGVFSSTGAPRGARAVSHYWPAAVEAGAGAAVPAAAGAVEAAAGAVEAAAGASAAGAVAAAAGAVEAAAGAAALSSLLLQPERAATAMRARAAIGANFMVCGSSKCFL